jgi:hypothetical protein
MCSAWITPTGCIESVYYGIEPRRVPNDTPGPKFYWTLRNGHGMDSVQTLYLRKGLVGRQFGMRMESWFASRYLVKSGPRAGYGFATSAMELKNFARAFWRR